MDEKGFLEVVRHVLREELKGFATKEDLDLLRKEMNRFATKEDLDLLRKEMNRFATKDDLDLLRKEMNRFATKDDLDKFATKDDLILLRNDLSSRIEGIHKGVYMLFEQMGKEFWDLRAKLELYDFNYLVKQNDRLTAIYETLRQEQTAMSHSIGEQEKEIKALKEKIKHG